MKKTILYFFLLLTLSCGNSDYGAEILRLEKLHQEQPTIEIKKQLVAAYQNFISNTEDKAKAATYGNQLTKIQKDLDDYQKAVTKVNTLTDAVKNNSNSGMSTDNIQMISTLLLDKIHTGNPKEAFSQFAALFSDTESMKVQLNDILTNLKNTMLNTTTSKWDRVKVNDFISLSRMYAGIMPKDAQSAEHLFLAAKIASSLGKYDQEIQIYDFMLADQTSFPDVAKTLFLKGYTLDEHLKKYDEAKVLYEKVVNEYPDSKFNESAKKSIEFLGKSTEEIMESFEKANN